jgi:tetratricopeptide (TPR) repeat protein
MLMLALAFLALTQAEPDGSSLTDAYLANVRDGAADLWLALDGQPSALAATASEGALDLALEGFSCRTREILPPAGRPVRRLVLNGDGEGGCAIRLEGQWREADAFLGEGGVLVALDGIELAPAPLRPAPAASTPTPVAVSAPSSDAARAPDADMAAVAAGGEPARPTALAAGGAACAQSASRLEDTPWDLNAMSAHGDCLAGSGSTDDAATLYERVLAFEPGHYGAALGLARLRAAAGDVAGAAELFQTAAESARTDGEALAARHAADGLERR